jgi:hypothetical protein
MNKLVLKLEGKVIELALHDTEAGMLYKAQDLLKGGLGYDDEDCKRILSNWKIKQESRQGLDFQYLSVRGKYGGTYLTEAQIKSLITYIENGHSHKKVGQYFVYILGADNGKLEGFGMNWESKISLSLFKKVGISHNVNQRLSHIQANCPIPLKVLGTIPFESKEAAYKYEQFVLCCLSRDTPEWSGEWFSNHHWYPEKGKDTSCGGFIVNDVKVDIISAILNQDMKILDKYKTQWDWYDNLPDEEE